MITRREIALAAAVCILGFGLLDKATAPKRDRGRAAHCESNLKQIGMGLMLYAQDYDDILPRAWSGKSPGPSDPAHNYKWMDAALPYVKDEALFTCPDDNISKPYHYRSGTNYGSYVINDAYYAAGAKLTPPSGHSLSNVDVMTALVMDGENDFQFSWSDALHAPPANAVNLAKMNTIACRHGSGMPLTPGTLWCDGTVRDYTLWQIAAPKVINGTNIFTGFTIERDSE